jgi:hypothetical protein
MACDCGWSFVDGAMAAPSPGLRAREDHDARRARGRSQIGVGVLLLAVGVVITAVTYGSASTPSGGTYIIAYGPIVFGVIRIVRGVLTMNG